MLGREASPADSGTRKTANSAESRSDVTSSETEKDVTRLTNEIARLTEAIEQYRDVGDDYDPENDPDSEIYKQWKRKNDLGEEARNKEGEVAERKIVLDAKKKLHEALLADLKGWTGYLQRCAPEVERAKRQLAWEEACLAAEKSRSPLGLFLDRWEAKWLEVAALGSSDVAPTVEPGAAGAALTTFSGETSSWAGKAQPALSCPSCGSPVDLPPLPFLKGWTELLDDSVRACRRALAELQFIPPPDRTPAACHELIAWAEKYAGWKDVIRDRIDKTATTLARAHGECEALAREAMDKRQEAEKILVSDERAAAASRAYRVRLDRWGKKKELVGQREAKQDELKAANEKLHRETRERDRSRAWAEYVVQMRKVLHRDALPRRISQHYMALLQRETNDLLNRLDCPFSVTAKEDLSFEATFADRRRVPAARLSGGEKVVLAIAFRIAVNTLFARDLGYALTSRRRVSTRKTWNVWVPHSHGCAICPVALAYRSSL